MSCTQGAGFRDQVSGASRICGFRICSTTVFGHKVHRILSIKRHRP